MDQDDYRALIAIVEDELRASGAAELADERHYLTEGGDSGARLLGPDERLVAMLEAFDRFVAVRDRATCERALRDIAEHLRGEGPSRATVVLAADDGPEREVDLREAPDLAPVRKDLRMLIGRLRDGDLRPGGEFA